MRRSLSACALAALLSDCGAGVAAPPAIRQDGGAVEMVARRSWMAPDAKKLDLLYVSDYQTNDVYAYSYPQGKLRGVLFNVLQSFVYPSGLCADAAGNVFIPDNSNATVLEYPHGSTKLVATLLDPNEYPYTCTIDPSTQTLAVVNLISVSGSGGISIYRHERGLPKVYTYPFVFFYYFGAYDANGNLFVDGAEDVPSEPFAFVELPKGGTALQSVTLQQSFEEPGGVAWDGRRLAVADPASSTVYRFRLTGSAGIEVGATHLKRARALAQYLINGTRLVGANYAGSSVSFWKYPNGAAPVKRLDGFGEPFGVALSHAR